MTGPPAGTELVAGRNSTTINMLCYGCQNWGHIRPNCPNARGRTGHSMVQYGFCLMQRMTNEELRSGGGINTSWILLDSCSTLSCFCNPALVSDIRPCTEDELMTVYTNGGQVNYDQISTVRLLPFDVYFDSGSMANILSLKDVSSKFRVTMDTTVENCMNVHVTEHQVLKFKQCGEGLHFLDTSKLGSSVFSTNSAFNGYSYLQTVTSNKRYFTCREVQGAVDARNLQQLLWWPSEKTYNKAVVSPYLCNCSVTPDDITRARKIHGPAIPPIKGNMVKRSIRTIKECTRSMVHSTPYRRMPKLMIRSLMEGATTFLNYFPAEQGIQGDMTPSMIVDGRVLNCESLKLQFESYVQLYRSTDNTPKLRSVGAIALVPSNKQGGYWFMSLKTGHKLHGYHWVELPITDEVIDQVEQLAEEQGQPLMENGPVFEWSPGDLILDAGDDVEAINDEMEEVVYPDDEEQEELKANIDLLPVDGRATVVTNEDYDEEEVEEFDEDRSDDADEYEGEWSKKANQSNDERETQGDDESRSDMEHDQGTEERASETQNKYESTEEENSMVDEHGLDNERDAQERPRRANAGAGVSRLEPSMKGKSHRNTKVQLAQKGVAAGTENYKRFTELKDIAVNACFTQMSARKGIERFGKLAIAAMLKEYKQLDDLLVFGAVSPDTMTDLEKKRALRAINLIKLKRCGKVKGRTCADGSVQRGYISKEDSSSQTISLQALFATWIIDAMEGRKVQTFDVPGAYLHAEIPEEDRVFMKFEKEFVDIMCDVNPEYKEHVRFENSKKVLYVQVLKAIYGMIESALRWYELFTGTLCEMGFELNPYDKCVANKMIKGSQCTVGWYVDDNKVLHVNDEVNTMIVQKIEEKFGKLARTEGNKHTFLGMDVEIIGKGKIAVSTPQHIEEAIEGLGEDVKGTAMNPAKSKLLNNPIYG